MNRLQVRRLARGFEQDERSEHVGGDEFAGAQNRPVDVRLGREVDDDVGVANERGRDAGVRDVAAHEGVPRIVDDVVQRLEPAGIGQLIERRDVPVGVRLECVPDEVRADEPGAAGDEN